MKCADEIYADMKAKFEERSGGALADECDMAVRMYAAAAEIEALYAYCEWIKGQTFAQTASGEYLDRHAAMRGIVRAPAAKAAGVIRFSVEQALTSPLAVPKGTVCITAAGVRFVTVGEAEIAAGEFYADAEAEAEGAGTGGNVAAGTVAYMVNAPIGVAKCTNPTAFAGGADEESDEALRERVIAGYGKLPNGANAGYYEKAALDVSGTAAVKVLPKLRGAGTVDVIVAAHGGMPTEELLSEVAASLNEKREICVDVDVRAPAAVTVDVTAAVDAEDGYDFADVSANVESAVRAMFDGRLLGKSVTRAELGRVIYAVEGVKNYTVASPAADVSAQADELPVLGVLTVNAWS